MPPQDKRPFTTDLRNIALGPKGFRVSRKRKLEEQEQQVCPVLTQAHICLESTHAGRCCTTCGDSFN